MNMDSPQRRRISILCSHLHPSSTTNTQKVYASNCSSQSATNENRTGDVQGIPYVEKDCIFCLIIRGQSPSFKLYEDDVCICILDRNPLSRGHSLVIPKLHCCSLDKTPPMVIAAICSKIPLISSAIKKATECDSFNLLVNNGAAAGQVVFHTHIHIIPRKHGDRLWNSESLRRLSLKLDQEASQLAESIRAQLLDGNSKEECKDEGSYLTGNHRE